MRLQKVLMLAAIFACIVSVGVGLGLAFRLERPRPGVAADRILEVQSWALWASAATLLLLGLMKELQRRRPLPAIPGTPLFNALFLCSAAAAIAAILWFV